MTEYIHLLLSRTIAERVKEHIAAVKNNQPTKSAIADHLLNSGSNHWIELHDPKVLSTDAHYYARVAREAVEIKKHRTFNREEGFRLSTTWDPVINKYNSRKKSLQAISRADNISVCNRLYMDCAVQVRVDEQNNDCSTRERRRRGAPVSS